MEPTSTFANLENLENLTEETCTRTAADAPGPEAGCAPEAAEPAEEAQAPVQAAPRRSYGLLETVRHPDDDLPDDDVDPTSMVLAHERPDVWEIGTRR